MASVSPNLKRTNAASTAGTNRQICHVQLSWCLTEAGATYQHRTKNDSEQCLRPANSLHKPSLSVHAAQHDDGTRPEPLVANDKLVLNGRCVRYLEIFFADETTLGDCF